MKIRAFPDITILVLVLLGALSLAAETWPARESLPLIQFLQNIIYGIFGAT